MAQVKKISVAAVYGKIKLSELVAKRSIDVMKVIGSAVGVKKGTTAYGEYTCLNGVFEGTNPVTGEISRASVCFLPDVALMPIMVALSNPDCTSVDFAIMVQVKYVADEEGHRSGGSAYEYRFTPLLDMGAEDPVVRIQARLAAQEAAKVPALAAPTVVGEVAAEVVASAAKTTLKAGK